MFTARIIRSQLQRRPSLGDTAGQSGNFLHGARLEEELAAQTHN